jgi:CRP/FNR family transcriptional regulator
MTAVNLQHRLELEICCASCPAKSVAICSTFGLDGLSTLAPIMTRRRFLAGQEVVHQGEASDLFAIVASGFIKLSRLFADGRQQVVAILATGDCIGEITSSISHDSAQCVSDVDLCCFHKAQFEQALRDNAKLEHTLLAKIEADLQNARHWQTILGQFGAMEKIAAFLLQLCEKTAKNQCSGRGGNITGHPVMPLPLKRSEIADFLGLTIETVSRNISKMRASGIINVADSHHLEIVDLPRLKKIAQSDEA